MSSSARSAKTTGNAATRAFALATAIVVAFGLAVLSSGASAASARSLASSQSYNDTAGDCKDPNTSAAVSTCDIQSVNVSSNDRGLITFKVGIPGSPALTGDMEIMVYVDSDQNPTTGGSFSSTGGPYGSEYALDYWLYGGDSSKPHVALWAFSSTAAATTVSPTPSSLSASYANGVATLTIGAAALGGADNLNFYAVAYSGLTYDTNGYLLSLYDTVPSDVAPDTGWWSQIGNTPISAARLQGKFTVVVEKRDQAWTFKPLCSTGACAVRATILNWPRFRLSRKGATTYEGGFKSRAYCYTRLGVLELVGTETVSVRFTIKKAAWVGTTWRATGLAGTLRMRAPLCSLKKSFSGKVKTVTLPIKGTLK